MASAAVLKYTLLLIIATNVKMIPSSEARKVVFVAHREGVAEQEISEIYAESSRPSLIYSMMMMIMGEADSMCVSRQDVAADPTDNATP
jgi:hypothetical protein